MSSLFQSNHRFYACVLPFRKQYWKYDMASLFLKADDDSVMWSDSKMEYETVYGFFLSETSWQGTDVFWFEKRREKGDGFSFSEAGTRTDYGFCVLDLGTNKSICVLFQTLRKAEHCLLSSEVFNSWVYVPPFWD
jgi:hypothetical protein